MAGHVVPLLLLLLGASSLPLASLSAEPRFRIRAIYSARLDRLLVSWNGQSMGRSRVSIRGPDGRVFMSKLAYGPVSKFQTGALTEGLDYTVSVQVLRPAATLSPKTKRQSFTFTTKVGSPEVFGTIRAQNPGGRRGSYFLPKNYRLKALPVMLLLHGSSITGERIASIFREYAKRRSFAIVAPDSTDPRGWSIETDGGTPTADQFHIEACVAEVLGMTHVTPDPAKFLVAGVSAGGEVALFLGSHDSKFRFMANLHGGTDVRSLGDNKVPVWMSTGTVDSIRPPAAFTRYLLELAALQFPSVTYQEFEAGHDVRNPEKEALLTWWLG